MGDQEHRDWLASGGKIWYVNHFPVRNEVSASTPLRPVFDATASYRGYLLDKLWEKPPNLIPDLPGLVPRFRERPVPIALDISEAYWSVHLELTESHLHRVLWNKLDPNEPVRTYRMTRNSWGMKPAGLICSLALLNIAKMHKTTYPHVHDFVQRQMYVDDGTSSCES